MVRFFSQLFIVAKSDTSVKVLLFLGWIECGASVKTPLLSFSCQVNDNFSANALGNSGLNPTVHVHLIRPAGQFSILLYS